MRRYDSSPISLGNLTSSSPDHLLQLLIPNNRACPTLTIVLKNDIHPICCSIYVCRHSRVALTQKALVVTFKFTGSCLLLMFIAPAQYQQKCICMSIDWPESFIFSQVPVVTVIDTNYKTWKWNCSALFFLILSKQGCQQTGVSRCFRSWREGDDG